MDKFEPTFLEYVALHLKEKCSKEAHDAFITDESIKDIVDKDYRYQRAIINKYFMGKLMMFRANSSKRVVEIIGFLIPDGDAEAWIKVFTCTVLPFIVDNKVKI